MSLRNSAFNFDVSREPKTDRNVFIWDRHWFTVVKNMAGKASGVIVPALLPGDVGHAGSMLCTDRNLENPNVTAGRCQDAEVEVFVMDPYEHAQGQAARLRAKWNPLEDVAHGAKHQRGVTPSRRNHDVSQE